MNRFILAIVTVLAIPAVGWSCNPVALVAPQVYAAPIVAQQVVAAPVVYQPVVQAVQVQQVAYAAPLQLAVVQNHHCRQALRAQRQQLKHGQPVRNALRIIAPPYGR